MMMIISVISFCLFLVGIICIMYEGFTDIWQYSSKKYRVYNLIYLSIIAFVAIVVTILFVKLIGLIAVL